MENRNPNKRDFETDWNDEPSPGSGSSDMESERGRTGGSSSSDIESDSDLGSDHGYGDSGDVNRGSSIEH
jgi:hypothetical protein